MDTDQNKLSGIDGEFCMERRSGSLLKNHQTLASRAPLLLNFDPGEAAYPLSIACISRCCRMITLIPQSRKWMARQFPMKTSPK
ncbi:hypothetical protein O9992_16415 [Vibrio lentus]|nr:hypothetical protein [Vibrio lentus]